MSIPAAHPVLSNEAAKAWEEMLLPDEAAAWTAMEKAGRALGRAVLDDFGEVGGFPDAGRILVLAGKGHNGGDALLAAREILQLRPNARAVVVLVFGPLQMRPLAGRALDRLRAEAPGRVELRAAEQALDDGVGYALCLDGIFGFQFRVPIEEAVRALIEQVNGCETIRFRAAVDLPSGIGEANAETPFRADFTYATGIVKQPVLSPRVTNAVGRLRYLDLGFFDGPQRPPAAEQILTASVLAPLARLRPTETDKRTYGHVFLVGGSRSYPGAILMAARAALHSGAGLVTAYVPAGLAPEYAARHPEIMWVGSPETEKGGLAESTLELIRERLDRASVCLLGPGLGTDPASLALMQAVVRETKVPLLFDADALRPEVVALARERAFIATPHAGEFKRIAPGLFEAGRFLAPRGILVLKGPMTRVTDGKMIYHSPFGGPVLARGGSGDILAGLTAGLLAQAPDNPLLAACRGVVWHGAAADLLARARGQVAVEITQLLEHLGPALLSPPCPTTP